MDVELRLSENYDERAVGLEMEDSYRLVGSRMQVPVELRHSYGLTGSLA